MGKGQPRTEKGARDAERQNSGVSRGREKCCVFQAPEPLFKVALLFAFRASCNSECKVEEMPLVCFHSHG